MSNAFDFAPLYSSMIGVDRMVDLVETALRGEPGGAWPPYDIEKVDEGRYRIHLAAAGFAPSDLEIIAQPNLMVVRGRSTADATGRTFLHQGFIQRDFERRFELADHVVVRDAQHAHGVLTIDVALELPEALKPRHIPISTTGATLALERPARRHAA